MKLMLPNPEFNPSYKLEHQSKLFFIGSCFAETMSAYFIDRKFTVSQNPFGILFNPASIANALEQITCVKEYDINQFHKHENGYSSWYHHSNFCEPESNELKRKLEIQNKTSSEYLKDTDVAFITLGTAWVYWHKELEMVVANNLKAPSDIFERRLLEVEDILDSLKRITAALRNLNKDIKIVFTVSPVRHSKQGLVENNRSKARLLEAIQQMQNTDNTLVYFPSYELVIDVLRDYRFYKSDFVHPNTLATDYIWEYMQNHFIDEKSYPLLDELFSLKLASTHRIRNTNSPSAQKFKSIQLANINKLKLENPYLDLEKERSYFEKL